MIKNILLSIYILFSIVIASTLLLPEAKEITNQIPGVLQTTSFITKILGPSPTTDTSYKIESTAPKKTNQIIVKYIEDQTGLGVIAGTFFEKNIPFAKILGNDSIDNAHSKYQIQSIKRVFDLDIYNNIPDQDTYTAREVRQIQRDMSTAYNTHISEIFSTHPLRSRSVIKNTPPFLGNIYIIEIKDIDQVKEFAKTYAAFASVEYAEPVQLNTINSTPNDPLYNEMYGLQASKMNLEPAWDSATGSGQIVAVIDTGLDIIHEDISSNVWENTGEIDGNGQDDDANGYVDDINGYDFSDNDSDVADSGLHGTHVAGTIAATMDNSKGIVGVAPQAIIMPIKVFPNAYDQTMAQAIAYAVDNGAIAINNSWGPSNRRAYNPVISDAIDYAVSMGVSVVFAAGNSSDDAAYYAPANHLDVITVAASNTHDNRAYFSNYGSPIDIAAPGVNIKSLQANGTYLSLDGTSMAAPHVTGLVALMKQNFIQLSPSDIQQMVRTVHDDIDGKDFSDSFGYGRVDAEMIINSSVSSFPKAKLNLNHNTELKNSVLITAINEPLLTKWNLQYRKPNQTNWKSIVSEQTTSPIEANIDTTDLPEGWAYLQLTVENSQNIAIDTRKIYINNKYEWNDILKFYQDLPWIWTLGILLLLGLLTLLLIIGLSVQLFRKIFRN